MKKKYFASEKLFVFLFFIFCISNVVKAQTLNPSSISTNGTVNAIVQDSTSIFIGGSFSTVGYKAAGVALIDAEGKNVINFPSIAASVKVSIPDGNGGWYVGGYFTYQGKNNLIHILADNTLDTSFTFSPIFTTSTPNTGQVIDILLDENNLFVSFTQSGDGESVPYLKSINAVTGVLNLNWDPNPNGPVNTIKKDGDILYIGGSFSKIGELTQRGFAAINANTGQLIQSISTEREVNTINQDDNNVYIGGRSISGGSFTGENGFYTGRSSLLTTSSDVPTHDFPQLSGFVNIGGSTSVSVPDGTGGWYIGGNFTYQSINYLIHILADNTVDLNFAPNPGGYVHDMVLDGNRLYVAGRFIGIGGQNISYLAAINANDGSVDTSWNPSPSFEVFSIAKDGNQLYVGGNFDSIGGKEYKYFAVVDTTSGAVIPSISTTGKVNVIKNDNENIYVGGDFAGDCGYYTADCALVTPTSDLPNPNFPKISGITYCSVTDGNGGWYIGGNFDYQNKNNLIHVLPDYSIDDLFAPNPNSSVHSLLLDGNSLIVSGVFNNINGSNINNLAKINAINGTVDINWNPNPSSYVQVITKVGSSYYIAGPFSTVAGVTRNYLAEIDSVSGTLLAWNPNPNNGVSDLKVNGNELIVGGGFTTIGGQSRNRLAIIDLTTGIPTGWNPNVNGTVNSILFNGTTVLIGGGFTTVGGQTRNRIAEIDLMTGLATTWNPNSNGTINDLTMIGTTVFAGGNFSTIGGQTRNNLAALDTSDSSLLAWNPNSNGTINAIDTDGTNLCLTGNFSTLKKETRNRFLAISKSNNLISALNLAPNSSVKAIELNGTKMYIGGSFSTIAGQSRGRIAEIDINTQQATSWNPNANTIVNSIKLVGATVYVGGDFTSIGGQSRNYLAAIDSTDGTASSWSPEPNDKVYGISYDGLKLNILGGFTLMKTENRISLLSISKATGLITDWNPNPNNNTIIEAIEIGPNTAYVSGNFTQIGGQQRNELVELDLTTGLATAWNPNPNNGVNCIKLINGIVYVGGSFTSIGGQTRNNLSALNVTDGTVIPWNPKPNGTVYDIKQAGQNIMISGGFSFVNSESRNNLFKISKADNLITDWMPNPNNPVQTIELDGNTVYTGGLFTTIGGQPRNRIAAIDSQTGLASSWNPNSNALVKTMKISGNTLYVGGSFTTIGGQSRTNLAGLDIATGSATDWTPNPNAIVNKVGVSNGILYAAGNFTTVDGQSRNRLASFTTNDNVLTSWDPNVSGAINDMLITGSSIYIGGSFNQVSGQTRNKLASFSKNSGNLKNWNPNITGTINAITGSGKYIYVGGNFTSVFSQNCSDFAMINANTGIPNLYFPNVGNGQINCLSTFDDQIFLGGTFTTINSNTYGGLASISFADNFFSPSVDSITPNFGGNGGDTSISITGNGFTDGTTVKLKKAGEQDIIIPAESTNIFDGIRINAILDLHSEVTLGFWNVVINIPNENEIILENAFEVQEGLIPDTESNILGFDVIRLNTWQSYNVTVENKSNFNQTGVPLYIAIDENTEIDFVSSFSANNDVGDIISVEYSQPIVTDSSFPVIGAKKVYMILISNLAPFETSNINFRLKTSSTNFTIFTWTDPSIYGSPMCPGWGACVDDIISGVIGALPFVGCVYGLHRAIYDPLIQSGIQGSFDGSQMIMDYATGTISALVGCIPLPGANILAKLVIQELIIESIGIDGTVNNAYDSCGEPDPDCHNKKPRKKVIPKSKQINIVTAVDPNDKLGPMGSGSSKYFQPNSVLPYIIRCENLESASASAQNVRIVDSLDLSVFDITTFQLGAITIKDSIISIPRGLKHFETDIDLRPENNIIARIIANLNTTTGVATWDFSSLEPSTLLPTENPTAGFLPPNINKPDGEASVMYTIKTLNTIENDIEVKNKAYIYFDQNLPIITNEWLNTTDIVKPQSQISNNPIIQSDGVTIDLSWSGSDIGSGVRSYAIYYSINGGAFEILADFVTNTTYTFIGELNNSYSFFTIATDNVGNIEDMKTMGEAQVTLGINQNELFKGISIYPNPSQGNFTLFVNSNENVVAELSITDLLGRVIYEKKQQLNIGDNHIPINLTNDGIYILNLIENGNKLSKKIIVKK